MFTIMGTIPFAGMGIKTGKSSFENGSLKLDDLTVSPTLGTTAMVAAACIICKSLDIDTPYFITAGDIGEGNGSKKLYHYISSNIKSIDTEVLGMHYIMPNIALMKIVLDAIGKTNEKMDLIADAGSMYTAKAGKYVSQFDIFTPDAGEMAYLADPEASHPSYVKHLLFSLDKSEIVTLINRAYENGNTPRIMLVKGKIDYIVENGKVIEKVDKPSIPSMEAIGGTGDSLVGILTALIYAGYDKVDACVKASRINRIAGKLAEPDPSTPVRKIIANIPEAIKQIVY